MIPVDEISELMRSCGAFIKNADRQSLHVDAKAGHANFVTDYDSKVQARLREGLLGMVPDALFVGEEGSSQPFSKSGKFFIVDPIDGTTNFIRGLGASCISVALVVDGTAEFGAVYNPYLDELFSARRGAGAFCNGRRICVSSEPLENGIVVFGTSPYSEELADESFDIAHTYFKKALDVRRSGSAALDLCSVAAGRVELFFELSLSPWDYAAGALLVEEAGGIVTDADGKPVAYDRKCSVVARNKTLALLRHSKSGIL